MSLVYLCLSRNVIPSFPDDFSWVEITIKVRLCRLGSVQPGSLYYSENLLMFLICKHLNFLQPTSYILFKCFTKGTSEQNSVSITPFNFILQPLMSFHPLFTILDSVRIVFLNWWCREYLYSHICCIMWCWMVWKCNFTSYWSISMACWYGQNCIRMWHKIQTS